MNAQTSSETQDMKAALMFLVAKVGVELALQIADTIIKAPTIEDAIAQCRKFENKTAQQYFDEAKEAAK